MNRRQVRLANLITFWLEVVMWMCIYAALIGVPLVIFWH